MDNEQEVKGVFYSDYEGNELLWSKSAVTKEQATELFKKWLEANNRDADLNAVHATRKWYCRRCNFYTAGDPICCECGKDFTSNGRMIFGVFL